MKWALQGVGTEKSCFLHHMLVGNQSSTIWKPCRSCWKPPIRFLGMFSTLLNVWHPPIFCFPCHVCNLKLSMYRGIFFWQGHNFKQVQLTFHSCFTLCTHNQRFVLQPYHNSFSFRRNICSLLSLWYTSTVLYSVDVSRVSLSWVIIMWQENQAPSSHACNL